MNTETVKVHVPDNLKTVRCIGAGFLDAGRVDDRYYKIVYDTGNSCVVTADVFNRACARYEEHGRYIVYAEADGAVRIRQDKFYNAGKGLWNKIKSWFADIQYKIPYFG